MMQDTLHYFFMVGFCVRGGKLMKKYNFKITFDNNDVDILEAQDFLEEVKSYIQDLNDSKKYDVSVIVSEIKRNAE